MSKQRQSTVRHLIISIFLFVLSPRAAQSQFNLTVEKTGGARAAGESNSFTAIVSRTDGTEAYRVVRSLPFDVPFPASYFSAENGTLVLGYIFDGFAEVYTADGRTMKTLNFFKELKPNYERTMTCAIGVKTLVFLTSDVRLANATLWKFFVDGAPVWQKEMPYQMGYEVGMSPDETTVVAGSYESGEAGVRQAAAILDEKGDIRTTLDFLFRKAAFSADNKSLALSSRDQVLVLPDGTPASQWIWENPQSNSIVTDIVWVESSIAIQTAEVTMKAGGNFSYLQPAFYLFSKTRMLLQEKILEGVEYTTSNLKVEDRALRAAFDGRSPVRVFELK